MSEKYLSEEGYKVGAIVYDEVTGEVFKVVACERIGVLDKCNFGITVEEVRSSNG